MRVLYHEKKQNKTKPVVQETWLEQISMKGFEMFEEDSRLRMRDPEGETHQLVGSYGHLTELAAEYKDGNDEIAGKVAVYFVERINVSTAFGAQPNGESDLRCLMYMIAY